MGIGPLDWVARLGVGLGLSSPDIRSDRDRVPFRHETVNEEEKGTNSLRSLET